LGGEKKLRSKKCYPDRFLRVVLVSPCFQEEKTSSSRLRSKERKAKSERRKREDSKIFRGGWKSFTLYQTGGAGLLEDLKGSLSTSWFDADKKREKGEDFGTLTSKAAKETVHYSFRARVDH